MCAFPLKSPVSCTIHNNENEVKNKRPGRLHVAVLEMIVSKYFSNTS